MNILYSRALVHFVSAYDQGNIRRAAEHIGVTQPAITKSIQKLEAHIETKLFDRYPEGIRPTVAAHMLYRHANNILNEARFVETEISSLLEGRRGNLRFGVGPAWSLTVFPDLLYAFSKRFPQVDIEVETGVTDHLLSRLENREIDFWLGSLHGINEMDEILTFNSGEANLRIFACQNHALAGESGLTAHDLKVYNWTTFVGDEIGLCKLADYFKQYGLPPPRISLRLSSMISMFRIASANDLLVLVADTVGAEARARGLIELDFVGEIWRFPTGMAYNRSTADLAVTRYLITQLQAIGETSI